MRVARLAERPDLEAVRAAAAEVSPRLRVSLLRPVLPVLTQPQRAPQLFDTMTRWRELAAERGLALSEVAIQYEMDASGWSRERVVEYMRGLAALMRRQTRAAYEDDVTVPASPFKPDFAGRWAVHAATPRQITDGVTAQTVKYAYGAGAGIPGVVNVPGPMGGGGGYVYAALSAVQEARGLTEADLLRGLFVAAGDRGDRLHAHRADRRGDRLHRRIGRVRRHGRRGDRRDGRRPSAGRRGRSLAGASGVHRPALRPHAGRAQPAVPQPHHGGHLHGPRLRRPGARPATRPRCRCTRPSTSPTP